MKNRMQRFVQQIKTVALHLIQIFVGTLHCSIRLNILEMTRWCSHRVITCFTLMWLCSPWSDAKFSLIWWNISYLTTVLFSSSPGRWVFGQLYPEHFVDPVPTLRRHCRHRLVAALQRGGKAVQRRRPPLLHWLLASCQEDFADYPTRNLCKLLMSMSTVAPVVKQRNVWLGLYLAVFTPNLEYRIGKRWWKHQKWKM